MKKKIILLMMLLAIVGGLNLSQLRAQQTVTFNFNDGSLAEWNEFQGSGAYSETWQITPYSNNHYKGVDNTNCLVSMSYDFNYGSTYKPNDYIVTKTAYQVTAESKISWQVKAPFSVGEYYEIVVSLDNVEWNSIYSETTNASSMQTRECPLGEYAGQTLYVGFRHFRETSNSNASHICIDDVVLSSVIPGGTGEGGETPDPDQPAAPVVSATATQNSITLTWDIVDGATSYNVYSDGVLIAEGLEANNYTADGLQMATGFCFTVTAVNEVGESAHSEEVCATTLAPVPATPENLTATDVDENSITLSWSPSEYATNYDIFDGNYEKVATGLTTTSYTVTGLNAETEYCFMVTATNNAGASQATELLCVKTAAFVVPEGPQTYTIGSGTGITSSLPVHMYYSYSYSQQIYTKEEINFVPGVISKIAFKQKSNYQFTRSIKIYMINTEKESFSSKTDWVNVTASDLVYDGTISTTSQDNWLEIALDNSFLYEGNNILLCVQDNTGGANSSFKFSTYSTSNRALNQYSDSYQYTPENIENYEGRLQEFNNQLQFVIEAADNETPAVPANLSATAIDHESIKLTWDAADKAKGYNIYNGEGVKVGSTSSTEFTVTGLAAKKEYCFTVKSVRFNNESAASEAACATTKKAPVIFTLNDSYGDGWNGNYLYVEFDNGEEPVTLGLTEGSTASYTIDILDNTNVKVTFYGNSYVNECSYTITVGGKNIYSSSGLSDGDTYEFYLGAPRPENLVATKDKLHYGETTTITWDALDGAVSYNIYNGGEIIGNTEETTYELSNLPANFNPGNAIAVTAVLEDESESGKSAAVRIKVAGSFPFTIKVTNLDEEPLAGATVTIQGKDEFEEEVSYEEVTDENGEVNIENMPMLAEYYSYSIKVELEPFIGKNKYVQQNELSYNTAYTKSIEMELQGVYVNTDKSSYDAGEPIVVTWDGIEASSLLGYNVYLDIEGEPINETLLEETIFVIEDGIEYGDGNNYVYVVAVYEEGRSDYAEERININAYGTISGIVTDGSNPIKNAEVVVKVRLDYYTERSYTFMTNEEGYFTGNVPCSYDEITATISKFGYENKTVSEIYLYENGSSYDCETIVLQEVSATPTEISNVVAENGNISWTAEYDNYNVYRKDVAAENVTRLGKASSEEYTDQEWAELNNGTYQYGVSTLISGDYGVIYEEGFENNPAINATGVGNCYVSYNNYSGSYRLWFDYINSGSHYVIMPWQVNPEGASLSFWYSTLPWNSNIDIMRVHYSTTPDISSLTEIGTGYSSASLAYAEIDLSDIEEDMIYIIFEQEGHDSNGSFIDDIKITGITQTESEVVWSENIVKNDANVFTGIADWSTAANWSNGVPAEGESVFIEGDVTISSDVVVNNITIKEGSVTIDNAASLTVEGTLINNVAENLVINDGGQIFQSTEGVPATFVMNIDTPSTWGNVKDGWQFIASPFTDASIHSFGMAEGDYDLYKYDGDYDLEWKNYKQHASTFEYSNIFEPGTAYLASYESAEQFVMKGTLNNETSFSREYLNYDYDGEKDLRNFTLIGNPFSFDMDMSKATFTNLVNGIAVVTSQGGWDYTQTTIPVGDGFFVQATGADASLSYNHKDVVPATRGSEKANSINVIASGKAGKDNVVVNFAGQAEGFNKLQNFNDAIATVYVSENGKNYGIANVDENTTEVDLNFDAKEMGSYTISLDVDGEFQAVTLVDLFTGVETNMLEDEYTFTATGNDNVNRFVIKLVNGQEPTANSQFVYQSGEELILSIEGSVQIVDMLGRVVYSNEHTNGYNRINVAEFNDASYVVRVINEEGVKVQKVVIY